MSYHPLTFHVVLPQQEHAHQSTSTMVLDFQVSELREMDAVSKLNYPGSSILIY